MPAEYDWGIYTTYPKSLYKGVLERGIVLSSASLLLVEYLNIITHNFLWIYIFTGQDAVAQYFVFDYVQWKYLAYCILCSIHEVIDQFNCNAF